MFRQLYLTLFCSSGVVCRLQASRILPPPPSPQLFTLPLKYSTAAGTEDDCSHPVSVPEKLLYAEALAKMRQDFQAWLQHYRSRTRDELEDENPALAVYRVLDMLRLATEDLPPSFQKVYGDLRAFRSSGGGGSELWNDEEGFTELVEIFYAVQLAATGRKVTSAYVDSLSREILEVWYTLPERGQKSTSAVIRVLTYTLASKDLINCSESKWRQFLSLRRRASTAYTLFRGLVRAHENDKREHSRKDAESYSIDDNVSSLLITACSSAKMPAKAFVVMLHMWVVMMADIARCG